MKRTFLMLVWCGALTMAAPVQAITTGPFGPKGEGGSKNGQSFQIGPGATVYELDSFLRIGAIDLNGGQPGSSAQLSLHALPPGLSYRFAASDPAGQSDLILTYIFSNN